MRVILLAVLAAPAALAMTAIFDNSFVVNYGTVLLCALLTMPLFMERSR